MSSLPHDHDAQQHAAPDQSVAENFLVRFSQQALQATKKAAKKSARVAIFCLPAKRMYASRMTAAVAITAIQKTCDGENVYFHLHLHDVPSGESQERGKRDTVVAAVALAVDIDAIGPGRSDTARKLTPSVADAVSLVDDFNSQFKPLRCGILIGSGHGIYPLLLFDQPFIIGSPEDRERLEELSRRYHAAYVQLAKDRGWDDAAEFCDLSKVLRLPGSLNWKDPGNPKLVTVLRANQDRFSLDEIERLLPTPTTKKSSKAKLVGGKIPAGQRNSTLISLAGSLRRLGFSEAAILEAILVKNAEDCEPPLDETEVATIAKSGASYPAGSGAPADHDSQATKLVQLASGAELFHTRDQEAYAAIKKDGHREIWRLKDSEFKRWLAREFYSQEKKAPSTSAIADALGVLEGQALFSGKETEVFTRMARLDDSIYLDLANQNWQAVRITADGWEVEDHPVVRFRRPRGMEALPTPEQGGKISELWKFANVRTQRAKILLASWLLGAFNVDRSFAVLILEGEQGSAKSTTVKVLRRLIDPNKALLRRHIREERDLAIAAANGWVVALDNISVLPQWLSDSICCLSTGGGFSTRSLYTDAGETIFSAMRPVILDGIAGVGVRGDLVDRSLIVNLPTIPPGKTKTEESLWSAFDAAHSRLLGAVLDAVSTAMKNHATVTIPELPRMADFAVFATAGEVALGFKKGDVMAALQLNKADANSAPLDASPIVPALRKLLLVSVAEYQDTTSAGNWQGTASELLTQLDSRAGQKLPKGWPASAHALSVHLHRIAPNLRVAGVDVTFGRTNNTGSQRQIVLHLDHGKDFCISHDAEAEESSEEGGGDI